jgi:hypothetical protein
MRGSKGLKASVRVIGLGLGLGVLEVKDYGIRDQGLRARIRVRFSDSSSG